MKCRPSTISGLALALTLGAGVHAQDGDAAVVADTNNLGSAAPIAAQAAGVYGDPDRDRRNTMIAIGAIAVGVAVAAGAFDSSSSHTPPAIVPPPTHGS